MTLSSFSLNANVDSSYRQELVTSPIKVGGGRHKIGSFPRAEVLEEALTETVEELVAIDSKGFLEGKSKMTMRRITKKNKMPSRKKRIMDLKPRLMRVKGEILKITMRVTSSMMTE